MSNVDEIERFNKILKKRQQIIERMNDRIDNMKTLIDERFVIQEKMRISLSRRFVRLCLYHTKVFKFLLGTVMKASFQKEPGASVESSGYSEYSNNRINEDRTKDNNNNNNNNNNDEGINEKRNDESIKDESIRVEHNESDEDVVDKIIYVLMQVAFIVFMIWLGYQRTFLLTALDL